MNLIPYLLFDGTCADAMQFYAELFGAEITSMMRWADIPPSAGHPVSDADKDRVMHAHLQAKTFSLMAADGRPGTPKQGGNISLSVNLDDVATGEKLFAALSDGGAVETPLMDMFWGAKFGQVTDKFGVDWMLNITLAEAAAHS